MTKLMGMTSSPTSRSLADSDITNIFVTLFSWRLVLSTTIMSPLPTVMNNISTVNTNRCTTLKGAGYKAASSRLVLARKGVGHSMLPEPEAAQEPFVPMFNTATNLKAMTICSTQFYRSHSWKSDDVFGPEICLKTYTFNLYEPFEFFLVFFRLISE